MKAILKFDMDNPDDACAHARCVKALDLALALYDVSEHLRRAMDNSPETPEAAQLLESMHSKFYEILADRGVSLDELVE